MTITEEQFEEQFKPQQNHILGAHTNGEPNAPFNGWGYETYGEEMEYVKSINSVSPKRVWTVLDTCPDEDDEDDVGMTIVSGFHYVNRQLYIITEHEWTDENTDVKLD